MEKSGQIAVLPPELWIEGVGFVVVSVVHCLSPQRNLNVWVTLEKKQSGRIKNHCFSKFFDILFIY